ncbi:hypothetical protein VE03_08541 [Pseudogymnoascus sp. 23342-1-I1]|nr:hypothetical protein VE03_08541 [Pseudogymnoascus sp. 23342-1-I1]
MASTNISRTTSWLPVTTAFSAPAACSSIIWGAHAPCDYALNTVADHGAAVQCQLFMEAGDVVTIVDYETFTSNNQLNSAWVTAVSTATGAAVVDGIQMNGWIFVPSTTYSGSTSTSTGSGSTSATSASSGSSSIYTATTPSTSGPTDLPTSTSEPTSGGLSSGTKIGLGVGVAGCLLAIGMLVTCLVCLRRKGRVDKDTEGFASNAPRSRASIFPWSRHEMPASPNEKPVPPFWHEVSGMKSPTEISGTERPAELPSQRWRIGRPVELPSERWSRGM